MATIEIDELRCKGCGLCTLACSRKLIVMGEIINKHGYVTARFTRCEQCTGCALCAEICPDVAITVFK
ncbi:2-oxoacid:acceptor oxidoreductase subunit delta [Geotalea uraniireducens]|uniref:2-oxoacid:acceptor oxidoreductase subunit delta n=1 Tax=Geotalea uraniireducens TaxID=351604 RepID=A0ABN6VW37_9BACT|nr:ferredoxin family protein [Geotalea uraniireducens]BDV43460.1 2-oxoacid:acceptor oxidoreductase subunit delta [Geotalea uraniireducens]